MLRLPLGPQEPGERAEAGPEEGQPTRQETRHEKGGARRRGGPQAAEARQLRHRALQGEAGGEARRED